MRFLLLLISYLVLLTSTFAQEDNLAKQYFNDGDYEKASVYYEKLVQKNNARIDYVEALVACYQQLERYTDAEEQLLKTLGNRRPYPPIYVELGYNATLMGNGPNSEEYYTKAQEQVRENPNYGYAIGERFQKYALLDHALNAYATAMELNPQLDFNFQMAAIYGEKGDIDKMYDSYLNLVTGGRTSKSNVLRKIEAFITADPENENNLSFKRILLENAQKNPDVLYNELLSWLFVQQKQFGSAFRQEKAIYKRLDETSLQRMVNLGALILAEKEYEVAQEVFEYIIEKTNDEITKLDAQLNIIDIQLVDADEKSLNEIQEQFEALMTYHGYESLTLQLQVAYANFLTFRKDSPEPAITILKKSLKLPLNQRGEAYIKSALGDILVFNQKFNEALIYFSQIQKSLKNDILGQNARYKVAQTSFYKGDFDWALTQLKVLRGSTSQLIANDAMQLSLLISDNSLEDSTQTALKKYARADLLSYQKKTKEAVSELNGILENHKGEKIEDDALLKQAELLVFLKDYGAAEFNYLKIIEFYPTGILADDAHFALGELYQNILDQPEKAKAHYEKIIYNYQDSYFFPQARKNFRMLRGDALN
ncbi:hypothetical protein FGM00_15185 [Aggregatimonas sangjinii]|uniref:Tetratricopeptide repeat protein n=1 Tax=Aggregatimonas sangjinii TaxID=2583587 RepID=A0A5B7SS86_9FLAO|nr:tetratricopeptide repeat protein [Aggregatimonas sangjinii]QCX01387.1 hypothetical protein FGM00_15185 [Aggregatimonas sangjinii]